jgi:uncharacterized protein YjbI with pentapeptide repeats
MPSEPKDMSDKLRNKKDKVEKEKILESVLQNLAMLGGDNGVKFFEETIGTEAKLHKFIASLRRNRSAIIKSQQTSESNRDLVIDKFDRLLEGPSGIQTWNSWKAYVEDCIAQYGSGVTLTSSKSTISILGKGFVGQIVGGAKELKQIKRDIKLGQNPPSFDFSEQDIARHYELPGINLSRSNLLGTALYDLDLTSALISNSSYGFSNFKRAVLKNADMHNAMIYCACVGEAKFDGTNFTNSLILDTDFKNGYLPKAVFAGVMMPGAKFRNANLQRADFTDAYLKYGDFRGADLRGATLVDVDLSSSDISGSKVYGVSVWNANLEGAIQKDIIITTDGEPTITVDNLEVAQFIYLLLNNKKIRDVIDTVAKKVVLILGNFERIAVLKSIKDELRKQKYLPVLFDFKKPKSRNLTETVSTLAHLSRFVIADITDPSSIPQELQSIIPTLAVAIQPILEVGKKEYSMFADFPKNYNWVLPTHYYKNTSSLLSSFKEKVIKPAEAKAIELDKR